MALPDVPADINQALTGDPVAGKAFARLAPSHIHEYLRWIGEAKQDATRRWRIDGMIERLKGSKTQRGNVEG